MKAIENISIHNERDLKSIKNIWLYNLKTKERIVIKYIVFYDGTGQVKITIAEGVDNLKEIIFSDKYNFYEYLSNYSKVPY
jgi:hypothetical protein